MQLGSMNPGTSVDEAAVMRPQRLYEDEFEQLPWDKPLKEHRPEPEAAVELEQKKGWPIDT
jgi:hypothetical protein